MNKRALNFALSYSLLVIAFKLGIILGGYGLTNFGFKFSHIVSVIFILPFIFIGVKKVRDKDLAGIISGKEAMRVAFSIVALSAILLSIYTYLEFNLNFRKIAPDYYRQLLLQDQLKYPDKITSSNFEKILAEQIESLSAFKSVTLKLIPFMFIGLGGSFVAAIFLKRGPSRQIT